MHHALDPFRASIETLRSALDDGRLSAEGLVRFYLDRIARFDKTGPKINAMITLEPKALDQARASDERRQMGRTASLLDGIPFVVKDNFDTAGLPTTGGSAALRSSTPGSNAFVVQKLLDAGAVLLGKANMSELAASHGRFGYSSAGGQTVNPFDTARHVSGSSSGSAAAVAAGFATFALGTDTSGSIRAPASAAGLVGLRPTMGLTSRGGVIPMSLTTDTTGPLARSVRDLAIVLDVIAHPDPADAATLGLPRPRRSYLEALDRPSLDGVRLGVMSNFRGLDAEVDAVEQAALRRMQAMGAVLVPLHLPQKYETIWTTVLEPLGQAEFRTQIDRYLSGLSQSQPRSLKELIEISLSPAIARSATPVHPGRLRALQMAESSDVASSPLYKDILARVIPDLQEHLHRTMAAIGLHALVFVTTSSPATPRADTSDASAHDSADDPHKAGYIASAVGFPEITVPIARVSANMPVGYSFLGLPGHEAALLGLAQALQLTLAYGPSPPSVTDG